jgi:hypothetical protein
MSQPTPLRMLALVAAPLMIRLPNGDTQAVPQLNAALELEEISAACKLTDTPVAIDIQTEIATVTSFNRAFGTVQGGFDIMHFSGHGSLSDEGVALVVEDTNEFGMARLIAANELRDLLGKNPCRVAFLSACHSEGLAATLLELGVTHVIAINADDAVIDDAARVFARRFYNVLLSGHSVQEAFERGMQEVRSDDQLRTQLDTKTFTPLNLTEAIKFRLLPDDTAINSQPLAAKPPSGAVQFRRPPWGKRTNLEIEPGGGAFFIGRQRDIQHSISALTHYRCVLIRGFGGMGKTALAEAVGRWQHERAHWPDGVVLVQLRNASTTADARLGIISALQEANIELGDPAQLVSSNNALATALRDSKLLLILDDLDQLFEHDSTEIIDLLNRLLSTRSLRLLLTSRRTLSQRIVHEQIKLGSLSPEEALQALRSYAPPRSWGPSAVREQTALPELLKELAGYPFAIRLAAAYLKETGCGIRGLLQRLRDTPRTTLIYPGEDEARETSLAATLNLSYDALEPEAQHALQVLALFPAGLNRLAARAILGEAGEAALDTLQRYAMAERHNDQVVLGGEDPTHLHRFILPEPARRYVEHLQAADLLEQYAPRALTYFSDLIADANNQFANRGQYNEGRYLLTLEQPNWRRFLEWGYQHEDTAGLSRSARATAALGNYWTLTGETATPAVYEMLEQARAAAVRLGDRLGEANVRKAIGDVLQFRKQSDAALASYHQALNLFQDIGAKLGEANVLQAIGDVLQFRKQSDAALASYHQALKLFQDIGATLGEANVLSAKSRVLIDSDLPESQRLLEKALEIRRLMPDIYGQGADLGNYGVALLQRGRAAEALPYLQRSRQLFAEHNIQDMLPQVNRLIEQANQMLQANDIGPSLPQLPADLQARLHAANVTDQASLAQALEADADLKRDYEAFIEANRTQLEQALIAQLISAFLKVSNPQALVQFWQQVPTPLEETFLNAVEAQIGYAEQSGNNQLSLALSQRLDDLRQLLTAPTPTDEHQPIFDLLNAQSFDEMGQLIAANPDLLDPAVDTIFAGLLERYADNEQALAHIQNRQALLQAIREQGIEAVKAQLQEE